MRIAAGPPVGTTLAVTRRYKVLLVDGNLGSLYALAELLGDEGFEVLTAQSTESGLDLARKRRPDLALVDVQFPTTSGIALIETLRERGLGIPVMLVASRPDLVRQLAERVDAAFVFDKPLDVQNVVDRIRQTLTGPQIRPEPRA